MPPPSMCYTLFIHPRANASTTKRSRYETGVCSSELPRLDLRASHERSRCADLARCRRKQPPRLVASRWSCVVLALLTLERFMAETACNA